MAHSALFLCLGKQQELREHSKHGSRLPLLHPLRAECGQEAALGRGGATGVQRLDLLDLMGHLEVYMMLLPRTWSRS